MTTQPGTSEADGTTPLDLLVDRLAGAELPGPVADLVLAAALGDEPLAEALHGQPAAPPPAQAGAGKPPPALFAGEIRVQGFRGIAGEARLGLRPGPGADWARPDGCRRLTRAGEAGPKYR